MWRLRGELRGLRLWQFISRKLLRWLTLVPLAIAFATTFLLRQEQLFFVLFLLQCLFYLVALIGVWKKESSRAYAVLRLPFTLLLANLAVLLGFFDACRGRKFAIWNIAALSRGIEGDSR